MTAKKQKEKERRRARKLADDAWEAVDAGNLDMAEKLIERAVSTQADNPRLWNDRGMILVLRENDSEADRGFRYAIRMARDYAEPYHHLATLRARQGRIDDAVALETDAVRLAPDKLEYRDHLEAYRVEAERQRQETLANLAWATDATADAPSAEDPAVGTAAAAWAERLRALDWDRFGEQLTREGCAALPGLLTTEECSEMRSWFDEEDRFVKTVVMDEPDFGEGVYRYFRPPIPAVIDGLRRAIYPRAATVANSWQRLLEEPETFPPEWEGFRDECRRAGQLKSAVLLLRYGPGGFNALHRDLRGRVFFPLQLAVVLSPRADQDVDGFEGGEFLFCDVPERAKARRRAISAGLGDAILFCTRDRLVRVGGAYGLQPVKHGAAPITAGTRVVLGLPFHEYR